MEKVSVQKEAPRSNSKPLTTSLPTAEQMLAQLEKELKGNFCQQYSQELGMGITYNTVFGEKSVFKQREKGEENDWRGKIWQCLKVQN